MNRFVTGKRKEKGKRAQKNAKLKSHFGLALTFDLENLARTYYLTLEIKVRKLETQFF